MGEGLVGQSARRTSPSPRFFALFHLELLGNPSGFGFDLIAFQDCFLMSFDYWFIRSSSDFLWRGRPWTMAWKAGVDGRERSPSVPAKSHAVSHSERSAIVPYHLRARHAFPS